MSLDAESTEVQVFEKYVTYKVVALQNTQQQNGCRVSFGFVGGNKCSMELGL
jgi:hypothetical protein